MQLKFAVANFNTARAVLLPQHGQVLLATLALYRRGVKPDGPPPRGRVRIPRLRIRAHHEGGQLWLQAGPAQQSLYVRRVPASTGLSRRL